MKNRITNRFSIFVFRFAMEKRLDGLCTDPAGTARTWANVEHVQNLRSMSVAVRGPGRDLVT